MKNKGLYDVLKGRFLTDESSVKTWKMIFFIVSLMMVVIYSSHSADSKVLKIAKLNNEKKRLRSEFVDVSTDLMHMKLESSIRKKLEGTGLAPAETPPQKIVIKVEK